jgi:hypothetical protein
MQFLALYRFKTSQLITKCYNSGFSEFDDAQKTTKRNRSWNSSTTMFVIEENNKGAIIGNNPI